MSKSKPTYGELEKRLAVLEAVVDALKHHEVDAVVGEKKIALLLLPEVTAELQASEAAFRAMFELPGVGMFLADSPGFQFTRVNRKFCEISGYSDGELRTKTLIGLTHPEDRGRGMKEQARLLRGAADSWSIEKRLIRKNGGVVRVSVNGTVLRDASGKVVRIMAMISDCTDGKTAGRRPR